jgi:GxxExxY protein
MDYNQITGQIISAAIEVHKHLGPGLLESAYEECLAYELKVEGLTFERQKPLPLIYKNVRLDCGYRLDFIVENSVILELKACDKMEAIFKAQLLTYLKLTEIQVGLLMNFNVPLMREGIIRLVNKFTG